ncbi:hypothetical protein IM774_01635 [Erysipelotrichaceae bacterium RD49]|nr:hypothetical protein [Erysipelotrichaceae bacterium RD49]
MEKQKGKIESGERWNLYLEDRILTDERIERGQKIPKDRFHLCIHVWIRNVKRTVFDRAKISQTQKSS